MEHPIVHRRRQSSSINTPDDERAVIASEGLDSTRRKVQRTIIADHGPNTVELWRVALQMLTHVRRVLPQSNPRAVTPVLREREPQAVSPHKRQSPGALPRTPSPYDQQQPTETYASKLVVDTADLVGPPLARGAMRDPTKFRHPRARHENFSFHSNSSSPQSTINGNARKAVQKEAKQMTKRPAEHKRPEVIGGLSPSAWVEVFRRKCDPEGVLTQRQVDDIVSWARDKRTLVTEGESVGKPESIQIWRVLEGMSCLTYGD